MYPLLEGLVQEGLISKKDDGRYELTPKAKQEFGGPYGGMHGMGRPHSVEDMLTEIGGYVSYFEDLAKSQEKAKQLEPSKAKIKDIASRLAVLGG